MATPTTPERHVLRMQRLWEVMTEAYGHRWTSTFHDQPNRTWARKCQTLTDEQMARGVEKSIDLPDGWPPSIGQYLELALGSYADHGMLEPPDAYGIYHAIEQMGGTYLFRRMEAERAMKRFGKSYQDTLEQARRGFRLRLGPSAAPPGTPQVTHQGAPSEQSIEAGRAALKEIREHLRQGQADVDAPQE
jgi:hypothetical protein